jgi:hypothetical protein
VRRTDAAWQVLTVGGVAFEQVLAEIAEREAGRRLAV